MVYRQKIPSGATHGDHRFLFRRGPPPIPCLALEHDLARRPGSLRAAEHYAFKLWKEGHEAHLNGAIFLYGMYMQLCVVLGPRVSMDRTKRVQLGLLDCAE